MTKLWTVAYKLRTYGEIFRNIIKGVVLPFAFFLPGGWNAALIIKASVLLTVRGCRGWRWHHDMKAAWLPDTVRCLLPDSYVLRTTPEQLLFGGFFTHSWNSILIHLLHNSLYPLLVFCEVNSPLRLQSDYSSGSRVLIVFYGM